MDRGRPRSGRLRAAHACAERWRDAEREVFLVKPKLERADLNDIAMGAAHG